MVEQMVMLFNEHKSLNSDEKLHIVTQIDQMPDLPQPGSTTDPYE